MAGLDHHRGGSGEPLVLVHGIGHTWRAWRPMLPRLEQRFDILAVDLPGFGRSAALPPSIPATPEALADAVEDEMGRAGFDTAHSRATAWAAGSRWSLRVAAAPAPSPRSRPPGFSTRGRSPGARALLRGMRWVAQNLPDPPDALLRKPGHALAARRPNLRAPVEPRAGPARGRRASCSQAVRASRQRCRTPSMPSRAGSRSWTCPSCCCGARSTWCSYRARAAASRLIPGAELRYLRGIGHTPMSDAPDLLAEAIESFALDRSGARPAQAAAASGL